MSIDASAKAYDPKSLIGKNITYRDCFGEWTSVRVCDYREYDDLHQLIEIGENENVEPDISWQDLRHTLYRVEGSDIIYRYGIPCPPSHPDWWKQSSQSHRHITSPSTWDQHVTPMLSMLLHGTISSTSPLRHLRGLTSTLLRYIWNMYISMSNHFIINDTDAMIEIGYGSLHRTRHTRITFPSPMGICINNMPFHMDMDEDLPDPILPYAELINIWMKPTRSHVMAYLTIYEQYMYAGDMLTHGCAHGIHIDAPLVGGIVENDITQCIPTFTTNSAWLGPTLTFDGGMFIASSHSHGQIWACQYHDGTDQHGSLHHLRHHLPSTPKPIKSHMMYWLTCHTIHQFEPIEIKQDGWYQYIRVVTSRIQTWDADRYTANPLGIQPDAPIIYSNTNNNNNNNNNNSNYNNNNNNSSNNNGNTSTSTS